MGFSCNFPLNQSIEINKTVEVPMGIQWFSSWVVRTARIPRTSRVHGFTFWGPPGTHKTWESCGSRVLTWIRMMLEKHRKPWETMGNHEKPWENYEPCWIILKHVQWKKWFTLKLESFDIFRVPGDWGGCEIGAVPGSRPSFLPQKIREFCFEKGFHGCWLKSLRLTHMHILSYIYIFIWFCICGLNYISLGL